MTGLGSSCGACKFLRRKCATDCIFAPYFCYDQAAIHFSAVHKVFGASNVSKLLSYLPIQNRSTAAMTVSYEALARMHDPVYGCIAHIIMLQQQVVHLEREIELLEKQMAKAWFDANYGSAAASPHSSNNFCGLHVETDDVQAFSIAEQTSQLLTAAQTEATDQTSQGLWEDEVWYPSPDPMDEQDIYMRCSAESLLEL